MSRTDQIIARFPDFFQSGESENLLYKFIGIFAKSLDIAEEDLLGIMRTHWVNTADNQGSKGFDALEKGDLDKIFALYLESLGATALLKQGKRGESELGKKDDDRYRTRIMGVIRVLQNGAATKAGIVDIVAANLGILPDLVYAKAAHDSIRIVEFLPEITGNDLPPFQLELYTPFVLDNDSPVPVIPEFRLHIKDDLPDNATLINPRIVAADGSQFIQFPGSVRRGGDLYFLSDGSGLIEGQPFVPMGGIKLPAGTTSFRLEAEVGVPEGRFNRSFFDFSQFDVQTTRNLGLFDATRFDQSIFPYETPVASLEVRYLRLYPGSFKVRIPWDIPGFSAKIAVTQHTLDRMGEFGLAQPLLEKLSALKDKEFETLDTFYQTLALLVPGEAVGVVLRKAALDQLAVFGNADGIYTKANAVLGVDTSRSFDSWNALLDALGGLNEIEIKLLNRAFGLFVADSSPLRLFLSECLLSDQFTQFNISPRAQIKGIVERVKAAGVYAVVDFEKRFREDQQLSDAFNMHLQANPKLENQDMVENDFKIASIQTPYPGGLEHEMSDSFAISGVFDYTHFDSLNGFA